jgi:hypothetical protein
MVRIALCLILMGGIHSNIFTQNYFSKLYRFDSLQKESVQFTNFIISQNNLIQLGIGAVIDSIYVDNLGFISN